MEIEDNFRHKGLRQKLVEKIRDKGIHDVRVLNAIGKVPRHLFMDSSFIEFAYKDQAFPIGSGQTISQPYTVAFQTELLQIKKGDKVLEIGTGSGYQAAVLLEMGAKVFTIERHRDLYLKAQSLLSKLGYEAYFFYGDGYEGKPSYSPYDKILITAAAPEIPQTLLDQLRIGGRMVVPVGEQGSQAMTIIDKTGENDYEKQTKGRFVFVPMIKGVK
jgi:protein-L-isoaspartate(D-aspartate) O-methyltransferase